MNDTEPNPPSRGTSRWIGAVVVLALLGGIAIAASQWSHKTPATMPAPAPEADAGGMPAGQPALDDSGAAPTEATMPPGHPSLGASDGAGGAASSMPPHASLDPGYVTLEGMHELMQAGLPPTNPHVWVDEVVGVDVSKLTSKQREIFLRHANAEECVCGYTVAACRAFNPSCPAGPGKAAALLDSVRSGRYRSAAGLRERPKNAPPVGHPDAG